MLAEKYKKKPIGEDSSGTNNNTTRDSEPYSIIKSKTLENNKSKTEPEADTNTKTDTKTDAKTDAKTDTKTEETFQNKNLKEDNQQKNDGKDLNDNMSLKLKKLKIAIKKSKKKLEIKEDEFERYSLNCQNAPRNAGSCLDSILGGHSYAGIKNDVKGAIGTDKYASELTSTTLGGLIGTGIGIGLISTGFLSWLGVLIIMFSIMPNGVKDSLKKHFTDLSGGILDFTQLPNFSEQLADYAGGAAGRNAKAQQIAMNTIKERKQLLEKGVSEAKNEHTNLEAEYAKLQAEYAKFFDGRNPEIKNEKLNGEKRQKIEKSMNQLKHKLSNSTDKLSKSKRQLLKYENDLLKTKEQSLNSKCNSLDSKDQSLNSKKQLLNSKRQITKNCLNKFTEYNNKINNGKINNPNVNNTLNEDNQKINMNL